MPTAFIVGLVVFLLACLALRNVLFRLENSMSFSDIPRIIDAFEPGLVLIERDGLGVY